MVEDQEKSIATEKQVEKGLKRSITEKTTDQTVKKEIKMVSIFFSTFSSDELILINNVLSFARVSKGKQRGHSE